MNRPRILLIGDSIRMGYAPLVREKMSDEADIVEIPRNGGDSHNLLTNLNAWLDELSTETLSVVHFNCGLHDIKRPFGSDENQQPLANYRENLERIIDLLKSRSTATLIWASTTPVIYQRHHDKKGFDRFEEDVIAYNDAAQEIMTERGIFINDLYSVIAEDDVETCIGRDGVHMTERGNELLSNAVVKRLRDILG